MIEVFVELVIPELQESIQVYAIGFAKDWGKFARAIIKVGDDYMDQEIEQFELQKNKRENKVFKE